MTVPPRIRHQVLPNLPKVKKVERGVLPSRRDAGALMAQKHLHETQHRALLDILNRPHEQKK